MKYKSITLCCLTLSMSVGLLSGCSSSEEQQEKYLTRAQEQFEAEDFKKARLELKNVLQINPHNAQAYYLQALMHEEDGNWQKMAGSLRTAVESDPTFIDAQIKLGQLMVLFGPTADEQTLDAVEAVLQLEPDNPEALVLRGLVSNRQGDKDSAIKDVERALAASPGHLGAIRFMVGSYAKEDPALALKIVNEGIDKNPEEQELKFLKIKILAAQGDTASVNTLFEQLVNEDPENIELLQQYALHLLQQKEPDKAVQILLNAIERNPEGLEFKLFLVNSFVFMGRPEEAEKSAKEFIAKQPDEPELLLLLAQLYLNESKYSEAETTLKSVIDIDAKSPQSLSARNSLIGIALKQGDKPAAEAWLNQIFEIEKDNTQALIIKASFELEDGETQAAIINLRTALKHDPGSVSALLMLSQAHQADGSAELALDAIRRAFEIDPTNAQVVQQIAALLYQKGDVAIADQLLEDYLKQVPDASIIFSQVLFQSYVGQKQWDAALKVASRIEQQEGSEALGVFLKGRVLFLREDYSGSTAAFESAVDLKPESSDALSAFVQSKLMLGETDEALAYLNSYIERYPKNMKARELLGSVYIGTGNIDQAIESYQAAILIDPERINTHVALGQAYQAAEDPEAALASYEAAMNLSADNPSPVVLMLKAGALESLGHYTAAADTYETLLASDSNQKIASNNLAMLLADRLASVENLQRAEEITADFETSDVPTLLDTRGWVLYRQGKYADAISLLEKAVSSNQPQPQFLYHLGMANYKMGNFELAKENFQQSLKNDASYDGADDAREKLKELEK